MCCGRRADHALPASALLHLFLAGRQGLLGVHGAHARGQAAILFVPMCKHMRQTRLDLCRR